MRVKSLFVMPLFALVLAACVSPAAAETPSLVPQVASSALPSSTSTLPTPTPADLSRADEQGAVVVTVSPENLGSPDEALRLQIVMETHSVELDMDLTQVATLETDNGIRVTPVAWDGSRGGHHVSGVLSFPAIVDGQSILEDATRLTLIIRDVDVPERVFIWQLAS